MNWIPGRSNPAYSLTKPILGYKNPPWTLISTNLLDIKALVWATTSTQSTEWLDPSKTLFHLHVADVNYRVNGLVESRERQKNTSVFKLESSAGWGLTLICNV